MADHLSEEFQKSFFLPNDDDMPFEEDILRNPFSVKHWLRYVEHKKSGKDEAVNMIYERALKELPGSYKLWHGYLQLRMKQVKGRLITDSSIKDVNNCFERSLVFMNKMPRIWLEYCQFLMDQCEVTRTRRTFDRSLQSLPITQHVRVWPLYLKFIKMQDIPETAIRVYKRYLKLQPEEAEEYIEYLRSVDRLEEAALKLADIVNNDNFISKEGKSKHQLWTELCELICRNPDKIHSLNVDAIIREGIKRYTDQQGKLWISLAEFYIRSGLFEKARDVYEEAILSVTTIRDFSQVFDAYSQSEEKFINAKMELDTLSEEDNIELDIRIARLEDLLERRLLLLNSVALRQNPHNVEEWHKRVQLLDDKPAEVIEVYTEAVQTVDPKEAIGKLYTLWVNFAKFYEKHGQLEDARVIFEKATQANFVRVEDLASVWAEWAEMELRHSNHQEALRLMQKATATPPKKVNYFDINEPVQYRVHKSLKIWSLYADLEESFGTFNSTKTVYDRIIDLRIATPQIIMNYGLFLEDNNYFEEAFKAYEKGVSLFKWPNVYDIWNTYLSKFLKRYSGKKLERTRDLFEQCLSGCPAKFAKTFYLLYAKFEEDYGLAKHAMTIYDRATKAVLKEEMFEMYNIYIKKAAQMYGLTYTRQIYEQAIEVLSDEQAREMCLRFAELERKIGEIDRARAIYAHCSQMCDPRTTHNFWNIWKEFEIKHGNEDTIREMLRIKRSVQASFNTQINYMTAQMLAASTGNDTNQMSQLEAALASESAKENVSKESVLFIRGTETVNQENVEVVKTFNPDEIDIDEEEDDDEEEDKSKSKRQVKDIQQKMVPREVFGSLRPDEEEES